MNIITSESKTRHDFLERTLIGTETTINEIAKNYPPRSHFRQMANKMLSDLALLQVANIDHNGVHYLSDDSPENALLLSIDNLDGGEHRVSAQCVYKFHDRQMAVLCEVFGGVADQIQSAVTQAGARRETATVISEGHYDMTLNKCDDINGIAGLFFQLQPFVLLNRSLMKCGDLGRYVMTHEMRHVTQYLDEPVLDTSGSDNPGEDKYDYMIEMEANAVGMQNAAYRVMGGSENKDRAHELQSFYGDLVFHNRKNPPVIHAATREDVIRNIAMFDNKFS